MKPAQASPLQQIRFWLHGVRLYIAIGVLVVSAQVWWWARTAYSGDPDLIVSRMHETYGWLALLLLAVTLGIGPAYKLMPQLGGVKIMRDARRLLGVGAAWFASLHASIAYVVSFQAINPLTLSATYRQAFVLGGLALLVLLAMAATSFNAVMKQMGVWWFRLHRLVYAAVLLAVWHAFTIGVHATSFPALAIIICAGLVLLVSHVTIAWQYAKRPSWLQVATLVGLFVLLVVLSDYGIQQYVDHNSLQGHTH